MTGRQASRYEIIGRRDRKDTLNGRGGGILLYSHLPNLYENTSYKSEHVVHVTVTSQDKNFKDLHIHVFYRSPNSTTEVTEDVLKYIENIPSNSILVGDFNYPEIDWSTLSSSQADGQVFLDTVNDKLLSQHVDFPTNFTPQPNGQTTATSIDLVLTDDDNLIASVKPVGQLGLSHHSIIQVEIVVPSGSNDTVELVPDYAKANFEMMHEKFDMIDWETQLSDLDTENSWNFFKVTYSSIVDACIPKKKRRNNSKPLWMQKNAMKIIRKKRKLWKHYTQSQDYQSYLAFKRVQNEVKSVVRKAKREFEKKLASDVKKNPKAFYSYLSSRCKVQAKVGPLKDSVGSVQTDDSTQAEILNQKFSTAFTREDLSTLPTPDQVFDPARGPALTSIDVTPNDVEEKIKSLKPGASGPDNVKPRTLRELSAQLALPISIIFNKSLSESCVPKDWKLSNVTAIFKKGDKTDAGNYRPISLTSIVCRILESIIRDKILIHLQEYNLIIKSQHGFWPHRSCLTNLLEFLEVVTKLVDEGHSVDVMFFDFSKAFDKVPHVRLISKVKAHGITGVVADWIEEWLKERKQRVVLNGKESDWADVLSGVPQGSVLGPCLFLIYINDLDNLVDSLVTLIKKFADDTKTASIVDTIAQCIEVQKQLDNLTHWEHIWQMSFNTDKCYVMHIGNKNIRHVYYMNGVQMKTSECEKDIGVYMHASLKPSVQIAECVKKANRALGMLLRCYTYRDRVHYIRLYKQYVRCHLEGAVQAWNPWLVQDIENIEGVQKRAINKCRGLQGSYTEKLKLVGLTSLFDRRRRGDMLQTFKILNNIDDVDYQTWFTKVSEVQQRTRQAVTVSADGTVVDCLNLVPRRAKLGIRKNFFSCRVVEHWNNLPVVVKHADNVQDFKVRYDDAMAGT